MKLHTLSISIAAALLLTACGSDDDNNTVEPPPVVVETSPEPAPVITAFDDDNSLDANIRWTTFGVPHIEADNLESLAFGSGYAYVKDHACLLLDQIVKTRGERAKFYGPDKVPGSGDSAHLISDFGYKALGVNAYAKEHYNELNDASRAHYEGFVQGFNKYVSDTGTDNLAPE